MNRFECKYAPYYCEENVYHLCSDERLGGGGKAVVFISNAGRTCAMSHQRNGHSGVVIWDYHVIIACVSNGNLVVYDLDSTLPFPIDLCTYVMASFPSAVVEGYRPVFRVVSASVFRGTFASDRRHMRRADGTFLAPPPPWPAIRPEVGSNLEEFIDMSREGRGRVVDRCEFANAIRAAVAYQVDSSSKDSTGRS